MLLQVNGRGVRPSVLHSLRMITICLTHDISDRFKATVDNFADALRALAGNDPGVERKLDAILVEIKRSRTLMNAETERILTAIDDASTELAADLQRLIDNANNAGSLTAAEINAALAPRVEFLQNLAHVSDAPVPDPPPPIEAAQ